MAKKAKRVLGDGAKGDIEATDTTTPARVEDEEKTEAKADKADKK